jgi:small acid-soluble spore protein (thioredoxin-like protein)
LEAIREDRCKIHPASTLRLSKRRANNILTFTRLRRVFYFFRGNCHIFNPYNFLQSIQTKEVLKHKEGKTLAKNRPNPDDRSDNVEKLQEAIVNTIDNMEEAEATMEFASEKDRALIAAKNDRRRESIEGMREEVKDEYRAQHDRSNS